MKHVHTYAVATMPKAVPQGTEPSTPAPWGLRAGQHTNACPPGLIMPMRNPVLVSSPLAEGTSSTPKALTTQKEKGDKVERVSQERRCESAQGLEKEL